MSLSFNFVEEAEITEMEDATFRADAEPIDEFEFEGQCNVRIDKLKVERNESEEKLWNNRRFGDLFHLLCLKCIFYVLNNEISYMPL